MPRKQARLGRRDFGSVQSIGTATDPSFSVRWWEGGKQRRKRGFATRSEAHAFLARIQTAMGDGVLDLHRKGQVSLAAVGDEWLKAHSAVKLRSHRKNVQRWAKLMDFFGAGLPIGEVTPSRIMQLRENMSTKRALKAATVNRHLALLRTILNHGVAAGYLQTSPVQRFPRGGYLMAEGGGKLRPPLANGAEALQLLNAINRRAPEWFALAAFLLFTGARRGEAAGLRHNDLDIKRRIVTIRRSYESVPKSGKARTVPLTAELCDVLADHLERNPGIASGPVFTFKGLPLQPTGRWPLHRILRGCCEEIGVEPMRVHDLRHGHASLWLMSGGTIADVQRNLGHSSPNLTVAVYGALAEDHRVKEADKRLSLGLISKR